MGRWYPQGGVRRCMVTLPGCPAARLPGCPAARPPRRAARVGWQYWPHGVGRHRGWLGRRRGGERSAPRRLAGHADGWRTACQLHAGLLSPVHHALTLFG